MTDISGADGARGRRQARFRDRATRHPGIAYEAGELNESALLNFAKAYKYEEWIAALSAMSGVKIATLDRLIFG